MCVQTLDSGDRYLMKLIDRASGRRVSVSLFSFGWKAIKEDFVGNIYLGLVFVLNSSTYWYILNQIQHFKGF